MSRIAKLQSGRGMFTCRSCGKRTRAVEEGDFGAEMCRKCRVIAETMNCHADLNHAGRFADCADCTANLASVMVKMPPADAWCDRSPEPTP